MQLHTDMDRRTELTRLALAGLHPNDPPFLRLAIIGEIARMPIVQVREALASRGSIYATPYNI